MWPMGHAAVAYLCYALVARVHLTRKPGDSIAFVLLVSSSLPDLIDKPLAWYAGVLPTGRSLGHSLLVLVPAIVLVTVLASLYARDVYGLAFGVGVLSHVSMDALPVLWQSDASVNFLLWPVLSLEIPAESPTLLGLLQENLTDPYFLFEFALLCVAVLVWRSHGYPGVGLLSRESRTNAPARE